jgi:hypothetical protein|tara:strand:- start:15240 stop:15440 length:201 start_codon:yes stop_codon:yes gene_type:complete
MEDESLEETTTVITKINPDTIRSGLHVRITSKHHDKLAMIVRETHRSRRDIVEMLIDTAKVGQYSE